jgi:hypothetical protein
MEKIKFNNLCSHYKDSFDMHTLTIRRRDTLFYSLLIILAIFTLQLSSAETVANILNEYSFKISGVKIGNNINFISTLMWLLLLGFSTRYFQIVLEIERQYDYLHSLEEELNKYYSGSVIFTREGKSYLNKYPLFSNWAGLLYTLFFPAMIITIIIVKIDNEIKIENFIGINQSIDLVCFLIIGISSVLYISRHIIRIGKEVSKYFKRIKS